MSTRSNDILFQLIHSLEKAEKRHFKLYIKRSSSNENLKIIQLFDAIDKQKEYDEKALADRLAGFQKSQLSNLKAHLYKQILSSLRLLKSSESLDLQLNEQFDFAHILYKKGLFLQSQRILEKAKELARANEKLAFLMQAISLEKRIEAHHTNSNMQDRAESLSAEALQVNKHVDMVARLSNLSLQLYSWYVNKGYCRNAEEEKEIRDFIIERMPEGAWEQRGFYERLYLFQSYSWYAFIRQDLVMFYRYAQKCIDLFHETPLMKRVETGHYIRGLHNLLNAHFGLRSHDKFKKTLAEMEAFSKTARVLGNDNFLIQSFLYTAQAKINFHLLRGSFNEGLRLVPELTNKFTEYDKLIDPHRLMVLHFKIATLYFGNGDFDSCIDQLQKIIHDNSNQRFDLQCYARILHLLAHYELGNHELMEYLGKSVYRFMSKKKNMTPIEHEMLKFLRRSFYIPKDKMQKELESFLMKIKSHENNPYHSRVFFFVDIISWVENKVHRRPLSSIIAEKYSSPRKLVTS